MTRAVAAALAVALIGALGGAGATATHASAAGIFSAADRASFDRLAARLPGREGVVVSGVGRGQPVAQVGSLSGGTAWSTSKTAVAMAVIAAGKGKAQRANLARAITASDNGAAEALWSSLGAGRRAARAADAQLRAAGDRRTHVESRRLLAGYTPFGQTDWSLADQARFTAGMGCTPAGRQVLGLMGRVIAAQRWGLGTLAGAQLKGGWGPGTRPGSGGGWMERQMGVVSIGGRRVAVTIATAPGGHGQGTGNLTAIARWIADHADASGLPRTPRC